MPEQPIEPSVPKNALAPHTDVGVARRMPTRTTRPLPREIRSQGIGRNDILFALFKHKKKIALGAALGLLAAAVVFVKWPAEYESDAKLLVRYLVERTTVDNVDANKASGSYTSSNDTIIDS